METNFLDFDTRGFGYRLKVIRRQNKLTQSEFGEKIDCKQATISAYEEGRVIPPLIVVFKIATLYRVDLNWLVRGQSIVDVESANDYLIKENQVYKTAMEEAKDHTLQVQRELNEANRTIIRLQKEYIDILLK